MKKETKEIDISEIKLDLKNTNKHTQYGMGLLEKSLQKLGAGRSIVLDKDNNVICGNGVSEVNATVGLPIRIVETDGNELIAVKRMDLNITDKKARELAIADNSIAHKNLEWDTDILNEWDSELLNEWVVDLPFDKPLNKSFGFHNGEYTEDFMPYPVTIILNEEDYKKWVELKAKV